MCQRAITICCVLLLAHGCGTAPRDAETTTLGVTPEFATTDQVPQNIAIHGGIAYVVNSGSNNLQRIHLADGASEKGFVSIPFLDGELPPNPWGIALLQLGEALVGFVSNNLNSTLSVVDLSSGAILTTLTEGLAKPQAVTTDGKTIFVANANYRFPDYGDGSVAVFDATSRQLLNVLATSRRNPNVALPHGPTLLVVNTGPLQESASRFVATEGSIDFFDLATISQTTAPLYSVLVTPPESAPQTGAPASIAISPDGAFAYIGSATDAVIFKLDLLQQLLVRGPDNPIRLHDAPGNALITVAMHPRGYLLAVSYNTDRLYIVDVADDAVSPIPFGKPIALGSSSQLEGPVALALDGDALYIVMGISLKVVKVDLSAYLREK